MSELDTVNWLERFFTSAFTLEGDVGELNVTETETTGDSLCTIRGVYGSYKTPNATVVELPLPWAVADGELWAIEVYATAKAADLSIRRRIKISALVYGSGSTATLDASPDVDASGTGSATATLTVSGDAMRIELDPASVSTPLTWAFEVRAQKS